MFVNLTLRRLNQEDCNFEASVGYIHSPSLYQKYNLPARSRIMSTINTNYEKGNEKINQVYSYLHIVSLGKYK